MISSGCTACAGHIQARQGEHHLSVDCISNMKLLDGTGEEKTKMKSHVSMQSEEKWKSFPCIYAFENASTLQKNERGIEKHGDVSPWNETIRTTHISHIN